MEHIKNLIYFKVDQNQKFYEVTNELSSKYKVESLKWYKKDLIVMNQIFSDHLHLIKTSEKPFLMLEMVLFKIMELDSTLKIEELLENYSNFRLAPNNTNQTQGHSKYINYFILMLFTSTHDSSFSRLVSNRPFFTYR